MNMMMLLKEKRSWRFLGLWLLTTTGAWSLLSIEKFLGLMLTVGGPFSVFYIPLVFSVIQFLPLRMFISDDRGWFWLTLIPHFFFFGAGLIFFFNVGMLAILAGLVLGTSFAVGGVLFFYNRIWGLVVCGLITLVWIVVPSVLKNLVPWGELVKNISLPSLVLLSLVYSLILGLILLIGFRNKPEQVEQAAS